MPHWRQIIAAPFLALLAACGGGGSGGAGAPPPPAPAPNPSGLDTRPSNASCVAPALGGAGATYGVARVFPNLSFASPVGLFQAPNDASRFFVVEQAGRVLAFDNNAGVTTAPVFIDIRGQVLSGGEQGLLGLAFHPDWATNRQAFLSYTANNPRRSVLSRFRSLDGGLTLNPTTEEVLLTVPQPFSNHNGGGIAFGPDGRLYLALGDGGSGGDPQNNAQTLTNLLGAVLRIDVNGAAPYGIPADNPFAANPRCANGSGPQNCPEIYAWGLRNPWRWSFDRDTGELWAGDVGQGAWEEIDRIQRGGNYGWRFREGAHCFNPSSNCPVTGPGGEPLIDPVAEYGRSLGFSVTGGHVYRGSALAALRGRYVFGDFGSGRIFAYLPGATPEASHETLVDTTLSISSFGEAVDGELYVVDYSGPLYRLVQTGGGGADPVPDLLSKTGCFVESSPVQPVAGLVPYAPIAAFWSDGAGKERWLALPNNTTMSIDAEGDFQLPAGAVLAKTFRLNGKRIETRLLMRHPDGSWAGYPYRWNDAETEATRVRGGATLRIGNQDYSIPSEDQCLQCHTQAAGRALGLEVAQLNSTLAYPATGRSANQLTTLDAIGMFAPRLSPPAAQQPALRDPYGPAGSLAERARAYLHTNCAGCHRPGGPTPSNLDLRHATALAATNACNAVPQSGDLGVAGARIVLPGDPARSVLVLRTNRRDANGMPPVASHLVDAAGVQLLRDWITALPGC